jgi:hypothetical protein
MKFRKKPVIIDAVQYTPGLEDGYACYEIGGRFVGYCAANEPQPRLVRKPAIMTAIGYREVIVGDWIVTDSVAGRWPCDAETFAQTYESADGPPREEEAHELIRERYEYLRPDANAGGTYASARRSEILRTLTALGIKIEGVNV